MFFLFLAMLQGMKTSKERAKKMTVPLSASSVMLQSIASGHGK